MAINIFRHNLASYSIMVMELQLGLCEPLGPSKVYHLLNSWVLGFSIGFFFYFSPQNSTGISPNRILGTAAKNNQSPCWSFQLLIGEE